MNEFYEQLAEIFEEDQVTESDVLRDFEEWDSLAVLSILALADSQYGVTISGDDVASVNTAGELVKLIESKKG